LTSLNIVSDGYSTLHRATKFGLQEVKGQSGGIPSFLIGLFGNAECRCGIEAAKAWGTTGDAGLARIPECPMWGELAARLARIVPKNPRKLERALARGLALRIVLRSAFAAASSL
jgi:hypothetical protein